MKLRDILVKVLTLGIGLAIGLVLVAKVCFELSYDSFYEDVDRIYCINTRYNQQGEEKEYGQVSGAVAPGFKEFVPGVEAGTRTTDVFNSDTYLDEDGNKLIGNLTLADTSFFDVFPIKVLVGNPKNILEDVQQVMVSRSFAEKLGGVQECIGKTIFPEDWKDFGMVVSGVYENFPKNGSLHYDILLGMGYMPPSSTENWIGNDRYKGYVKLAEGVDPDSLTDAIHKMQEEHQSKEELDLAGIQLWYYLAPFDKLHTSDPKVRNVIVLISVVALLMLIVTILNYVLMVISTLVSKSKEIGIRKCYGAEAGNIYGMLAKESAGHLTLGLILAFLILLALRGPAKNMLGVALQDLLVPQTIVAIIIIILLLFAVSVLLPGHLLNKIPVAEALRNYKESSRKWKLALLFVQFFITTFMFVMVILTVLQYNKCINGDLGYNPKNLVTFSFYSYNDMMNKSQAVADALKSIPEVDDVQFTYQLPHEGANGDFVRLPEGTEHLFNVADLYDSSEGFADIMDIKFIEGRGPKTYPEVAVSRSFVEKMRNYVSWSDGAIGKSFAITGHEEFVEEVGVPADKNNLAVYTITGVFEDYVIGTLNEADNRPIVLFYGKLGESYMPNVIIKLNVLNQQTMEKVINQIKKILPDSTFDLQSIPEILKNEYKSSKNIRNAIILGAIFSLLVAIFGLIGYLRNEMERKSKEMAIRKINGASTKEITEIFVWDILKIAAVAVVLADIVAFIAGRKFLAMFAQKISLTPLLFLAADLVAIAIIVATVILSCFRIAHANPVDSLKNE